MLKVSYTAEEYKGIRLHVKTFPVQDAFNMAILLVVNRINQNVNFVWRNTCFACIWCKDSIH